MADSPSSEREKQILRLITADRSNAEIGLSLRISPKTVEFHRQKIKAKLGVTGTAGLVRYAFRVGLIKP